MKHALNRDPSQRNCECWEAVREDRCQDRHRYRGMTPNATGTLSGLPSDWTVCRGTGAGLAHRSLA
jgi:hypothetical protein